ncbi:LysE family translocator [Kosakonia sacchari]|uniref:Threonine/homoserine/homoserine lactone efflux protein n=2 Tax=Kosakonia sacchari TaxID=1158459 RepID=A0A1G4XB56_9ENTR|nr:LysE family translocator [Kosakonia sacchari]MDN2488104.1 LysE family translocator [Kosakonia sacchari]SCX37918.1 Threonine/homoserine/homoserine lactone efflux protein [Kosakonia sacchari]
MVSMNVVLLGTYIGVVLTLLATPGPVVALVCAAAARGSHARAFLTLAGTNLASLVLIALAGLTLAGVVTLSAWLLNMVGLVGSLFIAISAVQALRALRREKGTEMSQNGEQGGFVTGFMTAIANPKDILFFIAFFPQFTGITGDFTASITVLTVIWVALDFSVLTLYILAVKRWLPTRQSGRFATFSSLILLLIGVSGAGYSLLLLASQQA